MAKGGARAQSGPPPDPLALRRDRKDDPSWVTLPAEGRTGDPPQWPLSPPEVLIDGELISLPALAERELELWTREWRRPQAVMWERNGQELEVALYVRSLVAAEAPDAKTNARTLVRQQQEALGLSLPGLARNRWRIADGPSEAPQGSSAPAVSARGRFTVVPGGKSAAA